MSNAPFIHIDSNGGRIGRLVWHNTDSDYAPALAMRVWGFTLWDAAWPCPMVPIPTATAMCGALLSDAGFAYYTGNITIHSRHMKAIVLSMDKEHKKQQQVARFAITFGYAP